MESLILELLLGNCVKMVHVKRGSDKTKAIMLVFEN